MLTQEQIDFFHENGFLRIRRCITRKRSASSPTASTA